MGAGVIPLAVNQGEVHFLFQKTFSGRKTGFLIDFGGGIDDSEDYRSAAAREFVEETETLYFADDLSNICRSEARVAAQIPVVEALFEHTLSVHPHWWRSRKPDKQGRPRDWRSFFIQFPFRDLSGMNREWADAPDGRFKKRRELHWVPAAQLAAIYAQSPEMLWKRVRQLEDAESLIREISASLTER